MPVYARRIAAIISYALCSSLVLLGAQAQSKRDDWRQARQSTRLHAERSSRHLNKAETLNVTPQSDVRLSSDGESRTRTGKDEQGGDQLADHLALAVQSSEGVRGSADGKSIHFEEDSSSVQGNLAKPEPVSIIARDRAGAELRSAGGSRSLLRVRREDLELYAVAVTGAMERGKSLQAHDTLATIERQLERSRGRMKFANEQAAIKGQDALQADADSAADLSPYSSTSSDNYIPAGPAYLNAQLFQESYAEMERVFRIYVYSEELRPLTHESVRNGIYAIDGFFFHSLLNDSQFLTSNPRQASMFFLPLSIVNLVRQLPEKSDKGCRKRCRDFVNAYAELVAERYPFWNRTMGADHFMLSCHDWGSTITRGHPELSSVVTHAVCNSNTTEGFFPHKDVAIPEIPVGKAGRLGSPALSNAGTTPPESRDILAFFAGKRHGPVRPVLFSHWAKRGDPSVLVYDGHIPKETAAAMSYDQHMSRAKFCLAPGGFHVNSPRIVEAIYGGCVPVVIADSFHLPFSDTLNWTAFSVVLPEAEIPTLKERLMEIPEQEYRSKQALLKVVRRHFVIEVPTRKYDVYHMILHSLWLKRLNTRFA